MAWLVCRSLFPAVSWLQFRRPRCGRRSLTWIQCGSASRPPSRCPRGRFSNWALWCRSPSTTTVSAVPPATMTLPWVSTSSTQSSSPVTSCSLCSALQNLFLWTENYFKSTLAHIHTDTHIYEYMLIYVDMRLQIKCDWFRTKEKNRHN